MSREKVLSASAQHGRREAAEPAYSPVCGAAMPDAPSLLVSQAHQAIVCRYPSRSPLLPTAADRHGGTRALPQGGLPTRRPIVGLVGLGGVGLDALLEGFPGGKRRDLFGGNLHRVPCARVASRP